MIAVRPTGALGALITCFILVMTPAIAGPLEDCQQTADFDLRIDGCTTFLVTASGDQVIVATYMRASAYLDKHDYYHASKDFTVVIGANQTPQVHALLPQAFALRGLAYVYQRADDPTFADKAISDLNQALALKPDLDAKLKVDFSYAYATRAATNLANGQDAQVPSDEEAAVQLNPNKSLELKATVAGAYETRALKNLAGGRYEQAVSDLQQAIGLDPTSSDKLTPYLAEAQTGKPGPYSAISRGVQHANDGAVDLAVNDYTEAIQANANIGEAYIDRGIAYETLNRLADARADFDQAIKVDPSNWLGYYVRGGFYQSLDQFDQASADYSQAQTVIERAHDTNFDYEKGTITTALKSLGFDRALNGRWISYLKEIQSANNYQNWSSAPYDLYVQNHKLSDLAPPASASPAAVEPKPSGLAMLLVGLVLALATGWGAIAYYRRRR